MEGHVNGSEIDDAGKVVIYEYWPDMDPGGVPDDVAAVLDEEAPGWRDMPDMADPVYAYIAGDESWAGEVSVHELRLTDG